MGRKDSPTITARFGGGSMSIKPHNRDYDAVSYNVRQLPYDLNTVSQAVKMLYLRYIDVVPMPYGNDESALFSNF